MKLKWTDIPELMKRVDEFVKSTPSGQQIVNDMLHMGAGYETPIVLTPDELEGNSTVCGCPDEVCFVPRVTAFLKSRDVKQFVVGVVPEDESDGLGPLIVGGAVPIPFSGVAVDDWRDWFPDGNQYISEIVADGDVPSPAQVLSELIAENGGSWRDDGCVDGWSTYESE